MRIQLGPGWTTYPRRRSRRFDLRCQSDVKSRCLGGRCFSLDFLASYPKIEVIVMPDQLISYPTRRRFLQSIGIGATGFMCGESFSFAQATKPRMPPFERSAASDMLEGHLRRRIFAALDARTQEYEKLKSPTEIAEYQKRRREFLVGQLGGFSPASPLNA